MHEHIKNAVGICLVVFLAGLSYGIYQFADSYAKSVQPSAFRSFSVNAEGKVVATPDLSSFNFSVKTEGGKELNKLQKENTEKMNKAIDFVKSKGVEAKDIQTLNYDVQQRYQYYPCMDMKACPPPQIVGYTVSQMVVVKIRKFDIIGDLMTGIVGFGVNDVSGLSFTIDDPTEYQNQARAKAIEKAKAKAEDLAKAGNFKIGKLLSIREGQNYPIAPIRYEKAMLSADMGGGVPALSIEAGSQDIVVNVVLDYEIK